MLGNSPWEICLICHSFKYTTTGFFGAPVARHCDRCQFRNTCWSICRAPGQRVQPYLRCCLPVPQTDWCDSVFHCLKIFTATSCSSTYLRAAKIDSRMRCDGWICCGNQGLDSDIFLQSSAASTSPSGTLRNWVRICVKPFKENVF